MSKEEVLKRMLIDEEALFERLVENASRVFKLDKTGNIVWMIPRDKITDRDKVAIALLAQQLAADLGIADTATVSNAELAQKLGMQSMSVGARMAELRDQVVAHQEKVGHHRVIMHGVEKVLDDIISKIAKDDRQD